MTALRSFEAERMAANIAVMLAHKAPTLRGLWLAAAEASEAVGRGYETNADEAEMMRLEHAAHEAEQALRDHLLSKHGLTSAELKRGIQL